MDTKLLSKNFARIGARVNVIPIVPDRIGRANDGIDIKSDVKGEYFDIRVRTDDQVNYEVIDMRSDLRHLLLMARRENSKHKFLCGHDERHWFVCAVPGSSVSSVVKAMEALQPAFVRGAVHRRVKRVKNRLRRRNEAFVRQGEWFFVPASPFSFNVRMVLRNEPLSRGGGSKPHMCEYMYRHGGEMVWVCRNYPQGLNEIQYRALLLQRADAKRWDWRTMMREPTVFVRGRVWHADHKTVVLNGWHRVFMNNERIAPGAQAVVFLD